MESQPASYKPWALIAIGVLIGLLSAGLILFVSSPPNSDPVMVLPTYTAEPVWVHISGAVTNPGVYALSSPSRLQDAIQAAGGLSQQADETKINLASFISDGQKIVIPRQGETIETRTEESGSAQININTASFEEIEALPGIGPQKASDILKYRETHGPFQSIDDLLKVNGIGEKTLQQIRPYITL
ncbi:MAG: ComEA family DNA-binding protein [Chloroflexi bacterium]|nr:ComEA family DNA-binding protein [Chloroflexota bacterium]